MKALLLTVVTLLASVCTIFAQNMPPQYDWEVGVNGGFSVITRPLGTATGYQGTRTNVVHDFSAQITRNFSEHWFLTFEVGDRKWQTFGDWTPVGPFGQKMPAQQITFQIADHALSESFEFNYNIPFYTHFHTYNRSNLYFGVMFGLVTTVSDGALGYNTYKTSVDSGATYVSRYDYGMGVGLSYGIQMGYTYYIFPGINPRLGINVQLAIRYAGVSTNDTRYGSENSSFYLLHFPETVGIRWRF